MTDRERGTEVDAAARANAGVETTQASQGDQQERASVQEVVLGVAESVVATGLVGGAKLAAGAVVDKMTGKTGGDHKAEKGG
jgi:hypothetical protein